MESREISFASSAIAHPGYAIYVQADRRPKFAVLMDSNMKTLSRSVVIIFFLWLLFFLAIYNLDTYVPVWFDEGKKINRKDGLAVLWTLLKYRVIG